MSDIQNRFLNVFLCLVKVRNPLNTTFLAKSIGKMHFYKYIYTSKSNYFLTNLLVKRLQKLSPSLEMPKQFIMNLSRENIFHTFLERADNSLKRSLNYLTRNRVLFMSGSYLYFVQFRSIKVVKFTSELWMDYLNQIEESSYQQKK